MAKTKKELEAELKEARNKLAKIPETDRVALQAQLKLCYELREQIHNMR